MNDENTIRTASFPQMPYVAGALALLLAACAPEVKIKAPDKPIVINLNVKIEQEVRIKIEKDIDDLLRKNKDIF